MNWRRFTFMILMVLLTISLSSVSYATQTQIRGEYCYQYGDSESLMVAKEISYAMALRKAIETYKTFVASTTVVKDFKLRKDLVEMIASGYVEDIKIVKQSAEGRNVCTELIGYVNPDAVKSIIARKVEKVQKTKRTEFKGLLSNNDIKILNHKKAKCTRFVELTCVHILYQAKKYVTSSGVKIYVDCYDREGNQISGTRDYFPEEALYKGEVREGQIVIDSNVVSYELRFEWN